MKIYCYDKDSKELLGEEQAQKDPLESMLQGKDVWLLPAHATFEVPPAKETGKAIIFDNGWRQVVDNRGKRAVNLNGLFEICYLGEKEGDMVISDEMQKGLDNGHLIVFEGKIVEKPASMKAAEKRIERNVLIEATDKYMMADYPISEKERELYREYRQYLRDIPEQDDFPSGKIKTFAEWTGA